MYYVVSMALGVPGEGVLGVGVPVGGTRALKKLDFSSAVKKINCLCQFNQKKSPSCPCYLSLTHLKQINRCH